MKKSLIIGILMVVCLMINPQTVWATSIEEVEEELLSELKLDNLDEFMEEIGSEVSFYELIKQIMDMGWGVDTIEVLTRWLWKQIFLELSASKKLILEVLLITFCFSLLKNTAGSFGNAYMSEISFMLVYSILAVLLLKSVFVFQSIVADALGQCVSFMKMFLPCFCTGMLFSSNTYSMAGFYQLAFLVIYLIEGAFNKVLLPFIHIYILLQIFNHFFEEGQFANLAELFETMINWGLKISVTIVLSLSTVQNLINPAKDRLAQGALGRTASAIPALGNIIGNMGELLLGAGMIIKNAVGIAGIIVLILITCGPLLKTLCLGFTYKIMAAIMEPLTDKRISNCVKALARGVLLYTKLLGEGMLLFLVMIAIAVSATSFVY